MLNEFTEKKLRRLVEIVANQRQTKHTSARDFSLKLIVKISINNFQRNGSCKAKISKRNISVNRNRRMSMKGPD
jgi:hypothetical protein